MSRGFGEVTVIQEAIPDWLAVIIALITQLGDIWFLTLLLAIFYWVGTPNREDIATIGGIWLAGLGLYKGLKEIFGLPRPDEPLLAPELLPWIIRPIYEATAFSGGFGFPSGHAINTTIVYFGLAFVLHWGTPRKRFSVAALIVGAVGFSRVALGLHYLVDIIVGIALGLILLGGTKLFIDSQRVDKGTTAFALGIVCSAFYVAASGAYLNAVIIFAAALGAFAGWQVIVMGWSIVAVDRPAQTVRPIVVRGGLAILALSPLVVALEYFPLLSEFAIGGIVGLTVAVAVTIPVLHHSTRARRVGVAIKFWGMIVWSWIRYLLRPSTWRRMVARLRSRRK